MLFGVFDSFDFLFLFYFIILFYYFFVYGNCKCQFILRLVVPLTIVFVLAFLLLHDI